VLASSSQRILERVGDDGLVLDVGGWAKPFPRADWVLDLFPYATRGLYEYDRASARERFSERTWVVRDICDREPWPFADKQFDFAVCSHTLEDVRDPLWVCSELMRVAKAGYIEVPSRLEEQSWGVNGDFVGWSHHRWLIDVGQDRIEFVVKLHSLHARPDQYFPAGFWAGLEERERVQTLWWTEAFSVSERVMVEAGESDRYLSEYVARELARRGSPPQGQAGIRARLSRLWRHNG
jgi:hypothetical protein